MVGVLMSGRCDNCRKRKKKCGEEVPSCSNCILAGWVCPGYKVKWKFVDETRGLRSYYAKRKYVYEAIDQHVLDSALSFGHSSPRNEFQVSRKDRTVTYLVIKNGPLRDGTPPPRYLASEGLASALVYCLQCSTNKVLVPLSSVGSFFDYIPARLGLNTALDDAVSCLCAVYGTPIAIPGNAYSGVLHCYTRALSSLQKCIDSPQLQLEPLTLCASILLQLCELAINVGKGEWSQLARGTAVLIRIRGPERYQSPFERSMLESQLCFILAQSMSLKEHCFLAQPEWQRRLQCPDQPWQPTSLCLRTRLSTILVHLPTLMINAAAFSRVTRDQVDHVAVLEAHVAQLITQTSRLHSAVQDWLLLEAEPLLLSNNSTTQLMITSQQPEIKFPEDITYTDILSGVLDCVSNTALIAIERLIGLLQQSMLELKGLETGSIRSMDNEGTVTGAYQRTLAQRRQRVLTSFNFIKKESILAAKPLEFGVKQVGVFGI